MDCLPHIRIITFWALILQLCIPAKAQEPAFVQLVGEKEIFVASNEKPSIKLTFKIKEGYHIMAHRLKDKNFIATDMKLEEASPLIFMEPVFPEGKEFRLKGKKEPLQVYTGVFEIKIPIASKKSQRIAKTETTGKLYYQACNRSKCYFPRNLDFTIEICYQK